MRRPAVIGLWILGTFALLVVLPISAIAIGTLIRYGANSVAEITIQNRSSELVVSGQVEALGDTYAFSNIAVGDTILVSFGTRGEGGYRIRARL